MAQGNFLTFLRKLTLFLILVFVALGSYLQKTRSTDWEDPLWVAVYPINADGSEKSARYISELDHDTFSGIEQFMMSEADRYNLSLERPVSINPGEPVNSLPPEVPRGSTLQVILWSFKLRYWAWSSTRDQPGPTPDVKLFLLYHDPETSPALNHSYGIKESLVGVVNVFADRTQRGSNQFVAIHELLHTLGATDKYDNNNFPVFPEGFAEPDRKPLYPQRYAEIMGGRIPVSSSTADTPGSLKRARIGFSTASEINWLNNN